MRQSGYPVQWIAAFQRLEFAMGINYWPILWGEELPTTRWETRLEQLP